MLRFRYMNEELELKNTYVKLKFPLRWIFFRPQVEFGSQTGHISSALSFLHVAESINLLLGEFVVLEAEEESRSWWSPAGIHEDFDTVSISDDDADRRLEMSDSLLQVKQWMMWSQMSSYGSSNQNPLSVPEVDGWLNW